jgi:hypothetical protein
MPALLLSSVPIDVKPAKTNGLADLGVPSADTTVVKKGKLGEFAQGLDSAKIGRRFQNIRVTGVKAEEGAATSSKLIVVFEVFGDDNVPLKANLGVAVALHAGDKVLLEQPLGTLFLPYACCWYENRCCLDICNEVFDQFDRLSFITLADDVRTV